MSHHIVVSLHVQGIMQTQSCAFIGSAILLIISAETNTTDIRIFVRFAIFVHNLCNHAGLQMYIFSTTCMELGCT